MELGTKSDLSGPLSVTEDKPKIHYPSFTLNGDKREEFLKACPDAKEVGYELTVPVKLRVSGNTDDKYSKSLSLDVIHLDDSKIEDTDEEEGSPEEEASETPEEEAEEQGAAGDEDAEEKVLGYKRPKAEKPAHAASGKDLME